MKETTLQALWHPQSELNLSFQPLQRAASNHWLNAAFYDVYPYKNMQLDKIKTYGEYNYTHLFYSKHPITVVSSFLGLPNESLREHQKPTWSNIGRQFIALPERNAKWWNYVLLSPLAGTFNTLKLLLTLPWNVLKLVTEFPLTTFRNYSAHQAYEAKTATGKRLALTGYLLTGFLLFFVRAATSPDKNLMEANKFGKTLFPNSKKGRALGVGLGVLSAITTSLIYTLALPFGLKAFATNVLPHIVPYVPGWMTGAAQWLAKPLAAVGQTMKPGLAAMGLGSISNSILGLSAVLLMGREVGKLASKGLQKGLKKGLEKFNSWRNKNTHYRRISPKRLREIDDMEIKNKHIYEPPRHAEKIERVFRDGSMFHKRVIQENSPKETSAHVLSVLSQLQAATAYNPPVVQAEVPSVVVSQAKLALETANTAEKKPVVVQAELPPVVVKPANQMLETERPIAVVKTEKKNKLKKAPLKSGAKEPQAEVKPSIKANGQHRLIPAVARAIKPTPKPKEAIPSNFKIS